MSDTKRKWRVTRRGFLMSLGATGGVLALGVAFGRESFYRMLGGDPGSSDPPPGANPSAAPDAWFEITPENQVRVMVAKVEMGQGIHTALAQIAAEELDARWDQIEVVQASTANGPGDALGTQASASITGSWVPLRTAAATMREMLRTAMANRLNTSVEMLETVDGTVRLLGDAGSALTYGEVVALTETWPEPADTPALKSRASYKLIGRSQPRVDIPAKVRGEAVYAYDLKLDGMLYGAVAHPPTIGATMGDVNVNGADEMPGVVQVVVRQREGFVGVVADTRTRAWRALNRIQISWSEPVTLNNGMIMDQLDPAEGRLQMQEIGNAPAVIASGEMSEAVYESPLAAHATMEPQAALADVQGDRVTVWTGTQFQEQTQADVASALGVRADTVEIVPTYVGGGFGRKLLVESAAEAALLSREAGRPVHVGWTRRSTIQQGVYRPPTKNRIQARMVDGQIEAIDFFHASGETLFPFLGLGPRLALGIDSGSYTGSVNTYDQIPNRRMTPTITKLPIRTGLWRGLGLLSNTFASECFMDELAHEAGIDPLIFRLNHLGESDLNRRLEHVLQEVANLSDWHDAAPAGRAKGLAVCADAGTCMAVVAEVSRDEQGIRVHQIWAAVDAGLIVNPDGAIAQIEGCMMMGTSATLHEEILVDGGAVTQGNFDKYQILRIDRAPEIAVKLVDSPDDPRGLGEYVIGPVAAAIGNGVFALTGERQRRLPLK